MAEMQLLVFTLARQRFGVRVEIVEEITPAVAGVKLPAAPPIVECAIDVHGRTVPLLDVRARFGLPARAISSSDHLIVARSRGRLVALRVDSADEVLTLGDGAVERAEAVLPGVGLVAGVAHTADGLILIHDLDSFLSEAESLAIDDALARAATRPPAPG